MSIKSSSDINEEMQSRAIPFDRSQVALEIPENKPRELSELEKLKIENIKLKITNHNLSAHFLENQGRQLEAEKSQLEKELGIEIK